jgi:hypothetical protein
MKKLVLSLLAAGALSIPATALALPTEAVFDVFIPNGQFALLSVGQMLFDLDADLPGAGVRACRFYVEWDNGAILPISADGFVLEAKTHGAASCLTNGFAPVNTIVQKDPTFPFYGFDRFQQFRLVNMFILGEDGLSAEMNGIIQFASTVGSPASFMTNSLTLTIAGP